MSTKEQSVTLLRKNKQAQVAAFNAVGMKDVTENSRASEFAKRIKWAGGLLDIFTELRCPAVLCDVLQADSVKRCRLFSLVLA